MPKTKIAKFILLISAIAYLICILHIPRWGSEYVRVFINAEYYALPPSVGFVLSILTALNFPVVIGLAKMVRVLLESSQWSVGCAAGVGVALFPPLAYAQWLALDRLLLYLGRARAKY